MRDETKELNDETRKSASGSFIQLPHGITHYELSPPLLEGEGLGVRGKGCRFDSWVLSPLFYL